MLVAKKPAEGERFELKVRAKTSNKIIQKGLAFRCDRSATVLASGVLLALRDPAPPAYRLLRGFGGAAG